MLQCYVVMKELSNIVNNLWKSVKEDLDMTNDKVRVLFTSDLNYAKGAAVINFLRGRNINTMYLNLVNPMTKYLYHCIYDDVSKEWFENTCYYGKSKGIFRYIVCCCDTHFK